MAGCPDFSDSDSDFSDDCNYYSFKERLKTLNRAPERIVRVQSDEEKRAQQLKFLFGALSSGHVTAVAEHLDNGLDVNVNVQDGWTPLLLAASFGNPELTRELIIRGADVTSDRDGCTALMMACNCPKNTSPFAESLDVIKQLVEQGANVKAINRKRMTALMFAANVGNLPAVKYLLPLSNRNAEDNQRWTPLFWAVNNNEIEVTKYLLEEGFDYTAVDVRSNTPLDIARNNDFFQIIELFPKEESDVLSSIIDSHSYTFEEIFSRLKKGEKPTFFLDICSILCGVKSEAVIKLIADKNITLYKFLSISDEELKNLGVKLPYQRNRILGGLYRFHKYPYHPKSLHVVPLNETYSNMDMAIQLLANIKQTIAMDAGLVYIIKNYSDKNVSESELNVMAKNIHTIQNKIRLCKMNTFPFQLDNQIKPVDLITAKSRKYLLPWRKILFSFSVMSVVLVFKVWK
ncbi:hypothetical protein NQ314_009309 [Rhamnusium bicolor]|uniref:Ankyrin repeat, SAM and basic leucine zipper domain-containing protein 1 n=1 Tax=Rhamnusium bicolor TaxID=1586634 RepID=A0AAV8Y3G5_9CUCU|nr:hypothetical protein NQ314_009309 [Rhamnusium bicolor]